MLVQAGLLVIVLGETSGELPAEAVVRKLLSVSEEKGESTLKTGRAARGLKSFPVPVIISSGTLRGMADPTVAMLMCGVVQPSISSLAFRTVSVSILNLPKRGSSLARQS